MYPVTNAYNTAIAKNARAHKLSGTVDGHSFDGGDVIRQSFYIRNQICPATAIELGGVYVGELGLEFETNYAQSLNFRGAWKGKVITVNIEVEAVVGDEPTFISIPMGTFTVESASWTNKGLSIVAYDNMSKLDKALSFDATIGGIYDFLSLIAQSCGVSLGQTMEQIALLPNASELLAIYPDSPIQTFRDLLSQVATACCCFATINRSGQLILVPFPDTNTVTTTITEKQRYSTSFSDYTSYYSTLKVTNAEDGSVSYYDNDNIGGLTMDIGANALLQYGIDETIVRQRNAVIDALENFEATPFNVSILPNPALDLGDVIQFTGGVGHGCKGTVMSITCKMDSTKIEGYGENPAATAVVSSLTKALEAQGKSIKDETIIHIYENSQQFDLGDGDKEEVVSIEFATVKPTRVLTFTEVNFDLTITDPTGIASATAYYYLNGQLQGYQPVGTWNNDGKHILSLMYPLLSAGSTAYEWKVALEVDGGTATIDRGDVHAVLEGQGLVALDQFDGLLTLTDTYTAVDADKGFMEWLENVNVSQTSWNDITLSEVFTDLATDKDFATWSESVAIDFFLGPWEPMITEDDYDLLTEDGDQFYTEGEIV